jgi:RNA polymerase sigma-70 factor (ECF subfamily)
MEPTLVMEPEPPEPLEAELTALIRAASGGDERSWERLVELYARRVYALARSRRLSPEMAEEITQSVFVTLASKLSAGQYDERGRFESWLFRVAMNRIRDEARRRTRHAAPSDPAAFGDLAAAPAATRDDAPSKALHEAMAQLSDADREIVELRHHGQMSFKQIAELLGEPVGTLLARHHRALKKLRDLIENAGEDRRKADAS